MPAGTAVAADQGRAWFPSEHMVLPYSLESWAMRAVCCSSGHSAVRANPGGLGEHGGQTNSVVVEGFWRAQVRGPLSALRTLGEILVPRTQDLNRDVADGIVVQVRSTFMCLVPMMSMPIPGP